MATMTSIARNKTGGFTLIESIVSMAVVAAGTMAVIASLKYGDNAALRARLDARGGKEFAKQVQWVVSYPSQEFRNLLPLGETGASNYFEVAKTNGSAGGILIPQSGPMLLRDTDGEGGFRYWTELEVAVPADPGGEGEAEPYTVRVATFWEVPDGQGGVTAGLKTNSMEMDQIRKW